MSDEIKFVTCPECGAQQADMGQGVSCENCGYGLCRLLKIRPPQRPHLNRRSEANMLHPETEAGMREWLDEGAGGHYFLTPQEVKDILAMKEVINMAFVNQLTMVLQDMAATLESQNTDAKTQRGGVDTESLVIVLNQDGSGKFGFTRYPIHSDVVAFHRHWRTHAEGAQLLAQWVKD